VRFVEDYVIAMAQSPKELETEVRQMLAIRWHPQGGATVTVVAGVMVYVQAMVRFGPTMEGEPS